MTPGHFPTVVIEKITPLIDGGRYPIKRIPGEALHIEADIFKDGHDLVTAMLRWRPADSAEWQEAPMRPLVNDRWEGRCTFSSIGPWEITIQAWGDVFRSWRSEFEKKHGAGFPDLTSETLEGVAHVEKAAKLASDAGEENDATQLAAFADAMRHGTREEIVDLVTGIELNVLMTQYSDRSHAMEYSPYLPVRVDRREALYAAWYEFFPRSAEGHGDRGSTFRECLPRVDDAKSMGFDVIYFPPIHPIGFTKRKGRNNSVTSEPGDPGVPYAIGSKFGGHKDVEPELGTMEDFEWLVDEIRQRGMEVALDFAINCSPDHPYVKEHPEWFNHRPDGSIKYAENPPKKYEDIYPLNFNTPNWKALWEEMRSILLFWAKKGVRIFRVDNPHTKPVAFWEWVIAEVQEKFPDVIFLSEAFTRPKMMAVLAKAGFTQSYTYFTWRNTAYEMREYLTELTTTELKWFFRGNFFTNTPDILPTFLQTGGRPAFRIRAVLATTLSPVYGMYSGFELLENTPVPGKEEYLDSEKYHFQARDWDAPGNIKEDIRTLNRIRRHNRALWQYHNLIFCPCSNDQILAYIKQSEGGDNTILVVVTMDPYQFQSAWIDVPLDEIGFPEDEKYLAEDLFNGESHVWRGARNYVGLPPHEKPAHVFCLKRLLGRRNQLDYYG